MNYFLTDHLGSVRVIVDENGGVLERNDYYPFGARYMRSDYPQLAANRFKYIGKELQVTGNLIFPSPAIGTPVIYLRRYPGIGFPPP